MPPRSDYQALIVMIQRGLAATLANPHPFAPISAHFCPKQTPKPATQH
ncbi:MAG: hypothetical protein QM759_08040 [Terricaulis sp.]